MSLDHPGWERAAGVAPGLWLWMRRAGGFWLLVRLTADGRYSATVGGQTLPVTHDSFAAAEDAAVAALRQWCATALNALRNHYPGRVRGPYRHKNEGASHG